MASVGADDDLIRPDTLRRISEEKEMEKLKEVLRKQKKAEEEAHALHQTFMEQEVRLEEARRNVSAMVRRAAEAGQREVMAFFPSEWCTDKGRAINNFESHWPETLTGFAKRATSTTSRSSGRPATKPGPRFSTSQAESRAMSASSSAGDASARARPEIGPHVLG